MKTVDKTVIHNLGLCAVGDGANISAIDVKDGRIVRVRPVHYDEHYTKEDLNYWVLQGRNGKTFEPGMKSYIPPFSMAFKRRTYSPNRVPFPLIRVDWDPKGERNAANRGKSKYRRASWDEVLGIIADEIHRIVEDYGPHSILLQADGHGETKAIHCAHSCMAPLLKELGGFTAQMRQPDSWEGWYWGAKHVWGQDPVGQSVTQFNVIQDVMRNSDAVLMWGCDLETTPWGWSGQQCSRIAYALSDMGIKQIHIAPDCNYNNAIHADKWIPVLPNTDAAFQLAIAYVWITEDLYDKEYIATHADGFDWFEYYVLGHEDGVPKTPEWAEEKCGTPAYTIKAFARYWARHNVSIAHGNGGSMIRSCFSHEPARLEIYLLGMQAVGHPGRNQFKFLEWSLFGLAGSSPLPTSAWLPSVEACYNGSHLGAATDSFVPKTLIPRALRGETLEWYGHVTAAHPTIDQFSKFSYPLPGDAGIRMVWSDCPCWQTCWNGGNELVEALKSETVEFLLVQHPWFENETMYADIVLPVSTKLELDDFGTDTLGGQWHAVIYEEHAIDPVCDSKSDYEIAIAIARALGKFGGKYAGLEAVLTKGKSLDEQLRYGYENCHAPAEFLDWETFTKQGYQLIATKECWEDDPVGMYPFYSDPVANPMSTPTGKLEYYSTRLATAFPDDKIRGPVAHWIEEGDGHFERKDSARAKDYPFLLVSNHPRWRVHAQLDDIPWFREIETGKIIAADGYAYEPIWVNPIDAERLGIVDGDVVRLFNERGAVLGAVRVTERIMPGVLSQDHGARVDPIVSGKDGLDRGGANNLICPSATSSKNAVGEVTSGFLVGIEKVDIDALAAAYPDVFDREHYEPYAGLCVADFIEGE